jgi:glyoxylase-like metal-dependent hydrolase (beta-lactamase superfamily II)
MTRVPGTTRHIGRAILAIAALATAVTAAACSRARSARAPSEPRYDVHAVRFATIRGFARRSLVAGAPASDSTDIAMMVWVVRGGGRTILVDAGFYREKFMRQWKPAEYRKPSDAIDALGLKPEDVTDIIVSHIHWDHADGADLFPKATVWLQKDEYEYYVSDSGTVKQRAIDAEVAKMFHGLKTAGRVRLIPGDSQAVFPGVRVFTGGKHTYASEYVSVATRSGAVVLASDNAYLYENLDRRVAIAQTLDAASNVAAMGRMLRLAAAPRLVVPGHDGQVFVRFPTPGGRVARID